MNIRRYFGAIIGLSGAYFKRFRRDKTALFFTILFPLIFLFVFGSIFNSSSASFGIAVLNQSDTELAQQLETSISKNELITVNTAITDLDTAKEKMGRSEIDSIIVVPEGFGSPDESGIPRGELLVYYSESSPQGGQAIAAFMKQILDDANADLGRPAPYLAVSEQPTSVSNLSQFDYTFSGLLGFTILSMGIFGLANNMPSEKKTGAFRRLRAAPFTATQLILSNGLYYSAVTALSLLLMIIVGETVFDFNMRGSWMVFAAFAILSITMIIGIGLAIGGWAKNEAQSAPLSNLVSFPLMFLSGTFFPRFLMPDWLQQVTQFLPLTPIIDGFRRIMTENASLVDVAPLVGLIAAWAVVIYAIAFRTFRWE